jgi:hypothetical protein
VEIRKADGLTWFEDQVNWYYSILRDDGNNNGIFVEVHASEVNNRPNLKRFVVTDLPTNVVGKVTKFKVRATNLAGY